MSVNNQTALNVQRPPEKKQKGKVKVYTKKTKQNKPETTVIEELQTKYESIDISAVTKFTDFPLSSKTLKGLKDSAYIKPTDIQREAILLGLRGKDILGAAQTGSGKTLAFLIPLLEILYCKQWTNLDGIGALVITPTRELAYQIFECLRKVGRYHDFSAGLIIGGKDLKFERKRMDQCNIIICTPGRLLQHMDENPLFDCVNMQVLVLDEADRCLDMGFEQTMNAIIVNLPPKRQTLLFSATQTKSVKDLARLSLKDPCYISVHENSKHSTPDGLEQSYVVCELHDKISIIWSFIKNHLKQKCIIFFSSCKQVKYIFEIFCKLRPGMSIMALYGTLHQMRRMSIYEDFCKKTSAVLFATDIAARGLDFPKVHWVLQADCPEDTDTYIHRVGRTARYHMGGESLLLLLPSEEIMVEKLQQRKIPINKIEINPNKFQTPIRKIEACLARDPELKQSAQRAFVSYVKSVSLMKDKTVFDVQALDTDAFAKSLGLAIPPRIRFLQRMNAKIAQKPQTSQNMSNKKYFDTESDPEDENNLEQINDTINTSIINTDDSESEEDKPVKKSVDDTNLFHVSDDSDSDDGILKVKRKDHDIELPSQEELEILDLHKNRKKKVVSKVALAKKILRKNIAPNKKTIFDEEGESIKVGTKEKRSELAQEYENENEGGIDIEKAKLVLREEDKFDKQLFKEKVKIKHKKEKLKLKEKRKAEKGEKDDFGTDSEGEAPDLSWLPDPDKIYGKANSEDDDANSTEFKNRTTDDGEESNDVEQSQPQSIPKPSKLKRKLKNDKNVKPMKKKKYNVTEETNNLSVNEAEELAMMLLKK